jgi:hypothetical protein
MVSLTTRLLIGAAVLGIAWSGPMFAQKHEENVLSTPTASPSEIPPFEPTPIPSIPLVQQEARPGLVHPLELENKTSEDLAANSMLSFQRGGGMAGWSSPTVGQVPVRSDFRATWFPSEKVAGQGVTLGSQQYDFSLSFPFWQDSPDEWSGNIHIRSEVFQTGAMLPNTGEHFPDKLWNVHLGTSYRHLFDNNWIGGGSVNLGSASDKPFATWNEVVASATAFLRVPQGDHNAWLFTLNLSTNSEVLPGIPIPGVAYFYAPSEWFQATIGLPFASVTYRPWDDLTLQLTYALLTNVHAKASYQLARPLRIFAAFDMYNESYFRAERLDDRDRFFYYDKRFSGGLHWRLSRHSSLDLSSGYLFDRYYFEGRNLNNGSNNRLNIGDGPFAAFQVRIHF